MAGGQTWQVVGGGRFGVVVTEGENRDSAELGQRLGKGATVEELEVAGERLHFKRLSGDGPASGWVSTTNRGRDLVVREGEKPRAFKEEPLPFDEPPSPTKIPGMPLSGWPSLPNVERREPSPPRAAVAAEDGDYTYVSRELSYVVKQLVHGNHHGNFLFVG
mmetsp:Transcript_70739/g.207186  ORF Transcript_70739/g.207186 Transcript_70739/m.207186 type:complete len:162 (+) Transcript_70739:74-559(+)